MLPLPGCLIQVGLTVHRHEREVAFEALRYGDGGDGTVGGVPGGAGVRRGTGPGSRQLDLRRIGVERQPQPGLPRERTDAVLRAVCKEGRGGTGRGARTSHSRLRLQRAHLSVSGGLSRTGVRSNGLVPTPTSGPSFLIRACWARCLPTAAASRPGGASPTGPAPPSCPYAPKCLEGLFCEVRAEGFSQERISSSRKESPRRVVQAEGDACFAGELL